MKCPNCNVENEDNNKFCSECGKSLKSKEYTSEYDKTKGKIDAVKDTGSEIISEGINKTGEFIKSEKVKTFGKEAKYMAKSAIKDSLRSIFIYCPIGGIVGAIIIGIMFSKLWIIGSIIGFVAGYFITLIFNFFTLSKSDREYIERQHEKHRMKKNK